MTEALALQGRLTTLIAARLVVLTLLLGLIAAVFGASPASRAGASDDPFTSQLAAITLGVGFALAAVYGALVRRGRGLMLVAHAQLIADQATWTIIVYLTGGLASGATSLYGLTCVAGAALIGLRGALIAALAGALFYVALAFALLSGVLPPPLDQPADVYHLALRDVQYHLALNLLVLVVVTWLASFLSERLRITGGRLQLAEARAEHAERLAALGRLAAGLAHEIRNPLGSISGSVQLLKLSGALDSDERQLCEIIQREAARLNDLVTDMLDLSKPRLPALVPTDAAVVVQDVVVLAGKSGRAASDVGVEYAGVASAPISADPSQLRQLVWNLVRNAVQASAAGDVVEVRLNEADGAYQLEVSDHGVGIDSVARERLFDAFFTTRSQGTGIGLAVVKHIADAHGFQIEVHSDEGDGATFRVFMPTGRGSESRGADQPA